MRLAFITPTAFIEDFGNQGDFHLALSHLIGKGDINEYETKLIQSHKPIILDNGLFENNEPEELGSLMDKAKRIGATHFFASDYLGDSDKTEESVRRAIYQKDWMRFDIGIGVIVQANNPKDFIEQYESFCHNSDVDLIGLSILSIPMAFHNVTETDDITVNRIYLLKELMKLNIKHKNCHLLGLGSSMEDVLFAEKNCPWVTSNDSCFCFQSGLHGRRITEDLVVPGGKIKEKVNFDLEKVSKEEYDNIQFNIDTVKDIL